MRIRRSRGDLMVVYERIVKKLECSRLGLSRGYNSS
jgi:hypothetical protein